VLIVSLGSTAGLRVADEELRASLCRAGASAALVRARAPRRMRTLMLTDLAWALAARRAARDALALKDARALIYSSTTAALFWPRPGAIRFDAPAAANRPGRHGLWQRPLERRRLREAPLLLPLSERGLLEAPVSARAGEALVLPVPVEPPCEQGPRGGGRAVELDATPSADAPVAAVPERDIAALAYAGNPAKKGLDRILSAWATARKPGEELVVAGVGEEELHELGYAVPAEGVRVVGMLPPHDYGALLARSRLFVCAARREDYGAAQLEALAKGCALVTIPSPGPYVALPIARQLDGRLVSDDLARSLRTALDDPIPGYAAGAAQALAPFRRAAVDRLVAEQLLPRLLDAVSAIHETGRGGRRISRSLFLTY
jgi:glycosyltransferase involved in cell wall biosynthesis